MDDLHELAKVYAASYASPHHITFTLDGLKSLIAALSQPAAQGDSDHSAGGECGGVQVHVVHPGHDDWTYRDQCSEVDK